MIKMAIVDNLQQRDAYHAHDIKAHMDYGLLCIVSSWLLELGLAKLSWPIGLRCQRSKSR